MSRSGGNYDARFECPQCGTTVGGPVPRETGGTTAPKGPKSPAAELVVCPDCEGVIDGFRPH